MFRVITNSLKNELNCLVGSYVIRVVLIEWYEVSKANYFLSNLLQDMKEVYFSCDAP